MVIEQAGIPATDSPDEDVLSPSSSSVLEGPVSDVAASDPQPSGKVKKEKKRGRKKVQAEDMDGLSDVTLPSASVLAKVRRIHEGCIEDYSGGRYAVWSMPGGDALENASVNGWSSLLNNVEYPIQILIRQHSPDYSDIRKSLSESRPEHMREGWINEVGNSLLSYLTDLEGGDAVVTRDWYVVGREDRANELGSAMTQSGFSAVRLDDNALGLLYQASLSGMRFGHTQDLYQVKEFPNNMELNQRHMSLWEVKKWPRRASPLFLEMLLRTGVELDISLWIWPVSIRESHSRLQMQRSRFEGSRIATEQKGKLVPPEVNLAIDDISRIADGVERGISRLYRRTVTIAVYGRTLDQLRDSEDKVKGHFRTVLSGIDRLKYRQGQAFACMMPTIKKALGPMHLTDSDTLLRLFPFGPRDMDTRKGTLLGLDMRSKTTVFIDPFAPEMMNGHMVVMARSGAGKSFFTKLKVEREATRGIPVYLIDPEGEYGVITRALGGEVFVPGAKGHGLNPFVVGRTNESDLAKRISSLCSLVGVMLEGTADQEMKAVIDRGLTGFYSKEWVAAEAGGRLGEGGMLAFYEFLLTPEAKEFGGDRLAHLLYPFARGSARFLMRGDARDLLADEAPVTAFNLKNLPSRLKPVATSICAEVVWGLAVTRPKPRILVVDECWTVLSTPSGAEALLTIVKRARKYQLGLIAITQDVQDFLAEDSGAGLITGHAGRALLQNSAMKLAFQQDPAALPQVIEALGLSDDVAEFLSQSLRGQGVLVGSGGDCYPLEIISTPQEYELIMDRSWLTDGDEGEGIIEELEDMEKVEVMEALGEVEGIRGGSDMADKLLRQLSMERENDGADPD